MPPEPSREPVPIATVKPTVEPTATPTVKPTVEPSATPTLEPTATPTVEPTATPTVEPTATPTVEPTATPTVEPTATPTVEPTATPMLEPTATPTLEPTATPTIEPTLEPAEDFYVYTNTVLTEDLTCRNLFLMGGNLTVKGCSITVQGNYLQTRRNCILQAASIDIWGNAHVAAGSLTAEEQSVFRVDGTMDVSGDDLLFENSDLMVQGDFSYISYGNAYRNFRKSSIQIAGNFLCKLLNSTIAFILIDSSMQVSGDAEVAGGSLLVESDGRLDIGGSLLMSGEGKLRTGWADGAEIYVAENFIQDSQAVTWLSTGSMTLGGDLIQTEDSAVDSLELCDDFYLYFRGEKRQKIALSHPSVTTLGNMDFRESPGIDAPDELHGTQILGFDKLGKKKKLDLYLSMVSLEQDETIHCEEVNWQGLIVDLGTYHLKIEGKLTLFLSYYLLGYKGKLTVQGDWEYLTDGSNSGSLTECSVQVDGKFWCKFSNQVNDFGLVDSNIQIGKDIEVVEGGLELGRENRVDIGGSLIVSDEGKLYIHAFNKMEIRVAEDFIIDSQAKTKLFGGNLTLGGNLIQTEDSAEDSLVFSGDSFSLILNSKNQQTIDLPYVDTISCLDLTGSAGVHLKQNFHGCRLDGLENILFDGDTLYTEFDEVHIGKNIVIDGNYRCRGMLYTDGHKLTIRGDYHQYDTIHVDLGSIEIMGNYTAHKGALDMRGEKFHVHGNVKIGKEAAVNMYGGKDALFLVEGDYVSASRSHLANDGTAGVLELKGDLIQSESAYSIGMEADGMRIVFSGNKAQRSTVPHVFGEVACIDMSHAVEVDFGDAILRARQIKGLSKIKNNECIVFSESRVTLEENETVNGELLLSDTYLDCNGHQLRVSGSVRQSGGVLNLNYGRLHTDGCYSITGNGILQMIQAKDVLRVDKDFTTVSTMSHATMLTNGCMELGGNFNQSGDAASFASSGKFTVAFVGSGKHMAHFDNIEYSQFANIDVFHNNFKMTDDGFEAFDRLLFSIGKGVASGLQEAVSVEELRDTVVAFMASYGVSIAAGAVINPPLVIAIIGVLAAVISVISASFMAAQAIEGIYDTATGTGTVYQKAEAYAHDAVLLIMSVGAIIGSAKELLNSVKTLRSVLNDLKGRATRFQPKEVLENRPGDDVSLKEINCIFSYDDFMKCVSNYLDTDALKYINTELGNDSHNYTFLRKTAQVYFDSCQRVGRKLKTHEVRTGLEMLWDNKSVASAVDEIELCLKSYGHAGLSYGDKQEILDIPQGKRKDPSKIYDKEYISSHLEQFEDGVSILVSKGAYDEYIAKSSYIGYPDNSQFVSPKTVHDQAIQQAQGDTNVLEKLLGFDNGHYKDATELVRIEIKNVEGLNLRMPSGNEKGANDHWIPGGYTDGGIAEAVTDLIPNDAEHVKISTIKVKRGGF